VDRNGRPAESTERNDVASKNGWSQQAKARMAVAIEPRAEVPKRVLKLMDRPPTAMAPNEVQIARNRRLVPRRPDRDPTETLGSVGYLDICASARRCWRPSTAVIDVRRRQTMPVLRELRAYWGLHSSRDISSHRPHFRRGLH
jgi:hypothetical protein